MMQAEIEDPFYFNAKKYFLLYSIRQSEPTFDVAKRELEYIVNNTDSVCEDDDLKRFRMFSERTRKAILLLIMERNTGGRI
ncbi:hypothetical protein [Lachnospira multipara]|uniref:hypothetical protein n=1 Tax=Lachnospira multipara TaxID=28051 RepID=UPI00040B123C|nr:hypothetical protein [Lachnospira multipara]